VAVSHRASDAVTRLIVDEYQRGSDGHYQLRVVGTDLCRCATTCGQGYTCMYMLKAISTMTLRRLLCQGVGQGNLHLIPIADSCHQ